MGKLISQIFFFLLSGLILVHCGSPKEPAGTPDIQAELGKGKVVASQGSTEIKEGYLDLIVKVNPNVKRQITNTLGKKKLVENLMEQELLYRESLRKGLQNDKDVQAKMAMFSRVVIAQALIDKEVENQAKTEYEKNKDTEFNQVKIAHIFFSTRPPPPKIDPKAKTPPQNSKEDLEKAKQTAKVKADEAYAKLKGGEAWQTVADTYSDDKMTSKNQGEIGYVTKNDPRGMRLDWAKIIEKAFAMKKDEFSEPILAKDGYHIVKVIEEVSVKPYDEVENGIKFKLRPKIKADMMTRLTGGNKINFFDEEIKKLGEKPAEQPPMSINPSKPGGMPPPQHPHPPKDAVHAH